MSSATRTTKHLTNTHKLECQTPHYNKHHHQISPWCLTHCPTGHRGQLSTHYHQTTYPSSPQLAYEMTIDYNKTDGLSPTARKLTGHNSRRHRVLFQSYHHTHQHTHCQQIIYKHHTNGRQAQHTKVQYTQLLQALTRPHSMQNYIKKQHKESKHQWSSSHTLNEEITSDIQKHKQNLWN